MRVKSYSIKDICEVFDGPHATPSPSNEGPIYLGITSIRSDGSIDYEGSKRIAWDEYPKWTKRVTPKAGDVVFSYEANLGTYAIIPDGFVGCLGRRMAVMRPYPEKVLPKYLYYYMLSPRWKEVIAGKTVLGATVNRIPIASYPDFPIELPDVDTQSRIVSVLSAYDELIENNRRQIKLLEEAAQRLYKEWFIDLKFPGHETTPIVDGLPEGWQKGRLLDCVDFCRGKSYTSDNLTESGKMRLANLNSIAAYGGWTCGAEKPYTGKYKAEQLVSSGDVIMAVTDMTKERRLIGHVARVPKHADGFLMSMDLIKLVPKDVTDNYLYAALRFSGIAEMIAMLANGTNVLHLKPDALNRVSFVKPDYGTQKQFSAASESLFAMSEHLEQEAVLAREARDRLLPKLMTDEVKE